MQREEREGMLDMFACMVLQSLISKSPFYDTEGEFGKKVSSDDLTAIKKGIAATAYEYAAYMMLERENQIDWLLKNEEYLNERANVRIKEDEE